MNNRNDAFYSDQEALEIIKKALDSGRVEITALQSALLDDGSTKEPVFCISLTLLDVEEENEGHVQMTGLVQTYREVSIPKPKEESFRAWLQNADGHLQNYGFGHEEFPLDEWRALYDRGASWRDAAENMRGEK